MPIVYFNTPVGICRITADDGFITSVSIRDEEDLVVEQTNDALLNKAMKQMDEYFKGTRQSFDLPLKQPGSDFQQGVWDELLKIPYGQTITYLQQAKQMDNVLGIRAIASANGRNHLWVIVPCHRVIGSDGSLTGYAGGVWRKQWLLEHEIKVLGVGQMKLEF